MMEGHIQKWTLVTHVVILGMQRGLCYMSCVLACVSVCVCSHSCECSAARVTVLGLSVCLSVDAYSGATGYEAAYEL